MVAITGLGLLFSPRTQLVLLALLGLVVIAAVYLWERDVFSPLGFLGLAYVMGWFGPAIDYAAQGDTDGILLGNDVGYLVAPMVLSVAAVAFVVLGYRLPFGDRLANRAPRPALTWNSDRAMTVVRVCCFVGAVSVVAFVYTTGGVPSSLSELSRKRFPPSEYLRWGTQFLQFAAIVFLVDLLHRGEPLVSRNGALLGLLIGLGSLTPFLASNRAGLLWFFVMMILLYHYVRRRLPIGVLALAVAGIALLANLMAGLRRVYTRPEYTLADLPAQVLSVRGLEDIAGAQNNGLSIVAHVYHLVPEEFGPMYGETLLYPLIFPIPRRIWPSKPEQIGQVLGEVVYEQGIGLPGGGVPPSLVGELYLNFLSPGVIVGSLLFGVVLRFGYAYCRPRRESHGMYVFLYAVFATLVANQTFLGQLNNAIIQLVLWGVPIAVFAQYITKEGQDAREVLEAFFSTFQESASSLRDSLSK